VLIGIVSNDVQPPQSKRANKKKKKDRSAPLISANRPDRRSQRVADIDSVAENGLFSNSKEPDREKDLISVKANEIIGGVLWKNDVNDASTIGCNDENFCAS
jgi:hypothetical protein